MSPHRCSCHRPLHARRLEARDFSHYELFSNWFLWRSLDHGSCGCRKRHERSWYWVQHLRLVSISTWRASSHTDLPQPHLCRPSHLLSHRLSSREEASSARQLRCSAQPSLTDRVRAHVRRSSAIPTKHRISFADCCTCRASEQPLSATIRSTQCIDRLLQSATAETSTHGLVLRSTYSNRANSSNNTLFWSTCMNASCLMLTNLGMTIDANLDMSR